MCSPNKEPFIIDDEERHEVGNEDCSCCWKGYPKRCDCGGLIHATFGDESWDGYWLYTKCDRCGENE